METRAEDSDTESDDFKSSSNNDQNKEVIEQDDLLVALASCGTVDHTQQTFKKPAKRQVVLGKLNYLDGFLHEQCSDIVIGLRCGAWSLRELSPADVSETNIVELINETSIHHRPRRMAPKHNSLVREE